jgi:hypothetical protein
LFRITPARYLPLTLIGLWTLSACSAAGISGPSDRTAPSPTLEVGSAPRVHTTPVVCPLRTGSTASTAIGPEGGSISLSGHQLTIPSGVLEGKTRFTLEAPAGRDLLLNVTADQATTDRFPSPMKLTISYARCKAAWLDRRTLMGLELDDTGGWHTMIAAEQDIASRSLTFLIPHFSTYTVAY